jgi:hypothetical protein
MLIREEKPGDADAGRQALSPEQKFSTGDLPGVQRLIASGSVSQVQIPSANISALTVPQPRGRPQSLTGLDTTRIFPPSRVSCASVTGLSLGRRLVSIQQAINEGAERRLRVAPIPIVEVEAGTRQ